ncbi:MAG: KpsF/GutQ family sugar-phosphate isomerase [Verrucomicrobia bacterium]|nr:KpsF/GutQ family sugar-phosphate isomerase [Verrucomicrobiota bacterium]
MDYVQRAREIIDIEIEELNRVRNSLNSDFASAVTIILQTLEDGGKIVVTGLGKSLHIGQKIAATFNSTGTSAAVLHPSEAMHGDLGILADDDVLLALSYSGASDELLTLLPVIKRRKVKVISITGDADSPLARHSDAVIPVKIQREACPFNMAPTASTTVTLAVGDALAMILLEARGFKKEDYAKLHPGGAIGRALLLRVADIMRTGSRLASVEDSAKVRDAVLAMTSARAGALAVTNSDRKVLGIFTDGDLRRHLTESSDVAELPIVQVMTADPITLTEDHLAVDVLTLFETHSIDDLIITDGEGRLVGMVDIQDLPKLKIL